MQYPDLKQLRSMLTEYYSPSNLRMMCFDMGVDYEDLEGNNKSDKVVSLIKHMQNRRRLDELVREIQRTRPFIQLKMSDTPPKPMADTGGRSAPPTTVYNVSGDMVQGDKMSGDKVKGNQYNFGDVSGGNVVIGKGGNINTGTMVGSVQGKGSVTATNISGGDINIGAEPKTKDEFNQQLQELKDLLAKAVANNEFDDADDGQDAADALDKVIRDANKDAPPEKLASRLDSVSGLIQSGAKVGAAVLKAIPVIGGLIRAASLFF